MRWSSRLRRTTAGIAALSLGGFVFAPSTEAIIPAPVYSPIAGISLTVGSTATPPYLDYAQIDASSTALGSNGIAGYTYDCGVGGTLAIPSTTATGAKCTWPTNPSPPLRPVTVLVTDVLGLHASTQQDFSTLDVAPHLALAVTTGGGASELTATVKTTGTTVHAGHILSFVYDCGPTGNTIVTSTGAACTYTTPGLKTFRVKAIDQTRGLESIQEAQAIVIDKPHAVLNAVQTAPFTVTADIAGSHVDPNLTGAYSIAWGDGSFTPVTPSTSTKATHAYAAAGHENIALTVTDSSSGSATVISGVDVTATAPRPDVFRLGGTNRYDTGVILAKRAWDDLTNTTPSARHPHAVVLARGDGYADALAGVPLAALKQGPLLLTPTTALDPEVETEIRNILPTTGPDNTIYILGGPSAVSVGVENHLSGLGYHVVRFGGADRFGTAMKIAKDPQALADPGRVVVATGMNFPDALSAGPFAALPTVNAAIVLSQDTTFDATTAAYVQSKLGSGGNVFAVGGQAVHAVAALPGSTGHFGGFAGSDRYDTAAMVAAYAGGFSATAKVGIATGLGYPDSLTGGALMAQAHGPILLTDPVTLSAKAASLLTVLKPTLPEVDVFGGPAAVSAAVFGAVVTTVNGIPHP